MTKVRMGMRVRTWAIQGGTAAFTAAILGMSLQYAGASSASTRPAPASASVINPYSPAYHHAYRHGAVPTRAALAQMRAWARQHPGAIHAASAANLNFGGGIDGIGVTTGHEKVYLVFWGSQWGTQGTNANGDVTFSNDPNSAAPYLQELFKGLGTGNELWSGVMTQYCEGVATGSQTCPASNQFHVAYPTGGSLAGVWA